MRLEGDPGADGVEIVLDHGHALPETDHVVMAGKEVEALVINLAVKKRHNKGEIILEKKVLWKTGLLLVIVMMVIALMVIVMMVLVLVVLVTFGFDPMCFDFIVLVMMVLVMFGFGPM